MSTAFAPTSHPNAEAGDEQPQPHYEQLPPPSSHVPSNGPFAHQLNPSTAAYASSPPQNTHRPARALRQQQQQQQPPNGAMASASANGNGQPVPVPGGRINGHGHSHGHGNGHGNGAHLREMGFAGPRSPPNNKSRSLAREWEAVRAAY